jgi:H+-transporting ATPase
MHLQDEAGGALLGTYGSTDNVSISDGAQLSKSVIMSTPAGGLTEAEAVSRLERFGRNELTEKETFWWKKLAAQFWGPMPCMIWLAILVEAITRDWADFGVLLTLQILNSTVGWYEDHQAGNAVAALKASLKPEATVKRNGRARKVDAAVIVPGDRVLLLSGCAVPADCELCKGSESIQVDQAQLTGESMPVSLEGGSPAMRGSTGVRGETEAIVTATGARTFFGRTAALIDSVDEVGHFQKVLLQITKFLMGVSLVLVTVVMCYLLSHGEDVLEAIAFSVVLLVASIPIAMQVVCTSTMALGSRALAEEGAIVSRLSAIEELAGMNMLCSDKVRAVRQPPDSR